MSMTINPVEVADALLLQANVDADAATAKGTVTELCEVIHCYVNNEGDQHGPETMELLNEVVSELSGTCHKNTDKAVRCLNSTLNRIGKRDGEKDLYNGRYLMVPTKRGVWQGAISKLIAEPDAPSAKQLMKEALALREKMDRFQKEFEGIAGSEAVIDAVADIVALSNQFIPEVTTVIEKNVVAFDVRHVA